MISTDAGTSPRRLRVRPCWFLMWAVLELCLVKAARPSRMPLAAECHRLCKPQVAHLSLSVWLQRAPAAGVPGQGMGAVNMSGRWSGKGRKRLLACH
mmetsp:Transcript_10178/g.29207  ORF Transcript_10178/g.29207 Transcript_10178/m.29207 type:complete len:97 (+) Transcript_10178:109-399(+)